MAFLEDEFIQLMLFLLLAGIALGVWVYRAENKKNPLVSRLSMDTTDHTVVSGGQEVSILKNQGRVFQGRYANFLNKLAGMGDALIRNEAEQLKHETLLVRAGYRYQQAPGLFVAVKTIGGVLFLLVAELGWLDSSTRLSMSGIAIGLMAWFVGGMIPELYVKAIANMRAEKLERSVPDALDLMVICAEAGLPLGRILKVVAREMELSAPIMADELRYTEAELQLVADRSYVLLNLAKRTCVPAIESMVASLIQAERYGTPLAQALRTIADESRTTLLLTLEERAGKLPAQLSLPLMTMILPPIVALMATPALVRVIRMLTE